MAIEFGWIHIWALSTAHGRIPVKLFTICPFAIHGASKKIKFIIGIGNYAHMHCFFLTKIIAIDSNT